MTHQVALADATYARLKREKQGEESFSRVIERLLANQQKDPMGFVRTRRKHPPGELARRLKEIEDSRNEDRIG